MRTPHFLPTGRPALSLSLMWRWALCISLSVSVGGCGESSADPDPEKRALASVKGFITANMGDLADAAAKLKAAAPAPDDDGWNATAEAAALATMKAEWRRARVTYEHIEGAIAVLFGELDYSTDQRYDAFLADNGPDTNLFDDENVTGIHAIERILWSDQIPAEVRSFESALPGYREAAFPATRQQADDFKNKLCARLVIDVKTMREQFGPLALDSGAAFRGIIGSMGEQLEKAELAATGEEESRYARYTLADMRTNVQAGVKTFQAFKPWLEARMADALAMAIEASFKKVQAAYATLTTGDALPPVPSTWSSQSPSAEDLQTPFGKLWSVLHEEADPDMPGSLVSSLNQAADVMGIPQLPGDGP